MHDDTKNLDKLIALFDDSIEGKLWRGSHAKQGIQNNRKSINTGYESLNKELHGQGWPLGTINEVGITQNGIGELRLLIPALRELQNISSGQRQIILIAPPKQPFAPALVKENIHLESISIVKTKTIKDSLWAAEQSLIANCCAAVICWTGKHKINNHDIRRLQLASEKAQSWSVLFRHSRCLEAPSASGLRIKINCNSHSKLEVNILKQPQSWGGQKCTVSLAPHYENWQRLSVDLLPVHSPTSDRVEQQEKIYQPSDLPTFEGQNIARPNAWHSSVTVMASLSTLKTVH